MWIILEWNGLLPDGFIGATLNENGNLVFFDTKEEAQEFAEENCAFEYRIVKL